MTKSHFLVHVPGYYSQDGYNSNVSLVAYRVNADSTSSSYNRLERMGKGLALNGAYVTSIPLLFLDGTANTTIQGPWPAAVSSTTADSDYETAGPQVFRFEYYYLLSSNPSVGTANQLSAGPWSSTDTFSVKDVAAIVVAIAVIDPKSKVLLTNRTWKSLQAMQRCPVDFTTGSGSRRSCYANGKPLWMRIHRYATPGHFRYSALRTLFLS